MGSGPIDTFSHNQWIWVMGRLVRLDWYYCGNGFYRGTGTHQ